MHKAVVVVLALAAATLGGCNTVKGAGQDITSVGQAGEDALDAAKD
jgi:predicted small secreted protein